MLTNTMENLIHQCCVAAQLWQRPRRQRRAQPAIISAQSLECRSLLSASSLSSFDFDDDDTEQDDHQDDNRLLAASDDHDVSSLREEDYLDDDDDGDGDSDSDSDDYHDDDYHDDHFFAAYSTPLLTDLPVSNHFSVLSDDSENSALTVDSTADQSGDEELTVLPAAADSLEESPAASPDGAEKADVAESLEDSAAANNTADSTAATPAATSALVAAVNSARAADADPSNRQSLWEPVDTFATDSPADTTETFPLGMPEFPLRSSDAETLVDPAGNTGGVFRQLLMVPEGPWPAASSVTHRANYAAMIREGSLTLEPAEGLVLNPREAASLRGPVDTLVNASSASARLSLAISAVLLITWLGAREQRCVERRRISAG